MSTDYSDLQTASQNFWAGRTGRETPPAPTLREVDGKQMLGRYMDPWGCEAMKRACHAGWNDWLTNFFWFAAPCLLFLEFDWFSLFIIVPVVMARYTYVKAKWRSKYVYYESIQQKIMETDEPQWVPYDAKRLKKMDRLPPSVSP
jgi:hypothetical protein